MVQEYPSLMGWLRESDSLLPLRTKCASSESYVESCISTGNSLTTGTSTANDFEWATFSDILYLNGYDIEASMDHSAYFSPLDRVRKGRCRVSGKIVYIRALPTFDGPSEELVALQILHHRVLLDDPCNRVIEIQRIMQACLDGISVTFVIQVDGGHCAYEYDWNNVDETVWRFFVLQVFEAVDCFHRWSITHLDLSASNILWDSHRSRISVIDWRGAQIHRSARLRTVARPFLAVNARLPELADASAPWCPFKADVWCVADTLLQLRRPRDDDITTLLRFCAVSTPSARPSIAYALRKLYALLGRGNAGPSALD